MKVDERPLVARITVRCNECIRQIAVVTFAGFSLEDALNDVGWTYGATDEHYCEGHS